MSFVDENVLNLQLTSMVEMNDDNHVKAINFVFIVNNVKCASTQEKNIYIR